MLRILNTSQLEGYVYKTPGGPPCELIAGNVKKIIKDGEDFLVHITGHQFINGKYVSCEVKVYFIDRGPNRKMCATRLIAARVSVGSYISVLVMQQNEIRIVLDFKYSGLWRLKGYSGEKNVLIGRTHNYQVATDGKVSVQFIDKDKANQRIFVRSVVFSEKAINEAAQTLLSPKSVDSSYVICICGPESKLSEISFYDCKSFEVVPNSRFCK